MSTPPKPKLRHISRGDEILVDGEWYPVAGFALRVSPHSETTGSVFTTKPRGKFELQLGYRIDYSEIEQVRP